MEELKGVSTKSEEPFGPSKQVQRPEAIAEARKVEPKKCTSKGD